ncbi:lipid A-modifier LpxR family protein [Maricaulis sp.]|uniref:lipid A-modifier LpxR family protein n=1 Tax=Maricaulis sp. TaxID=1486257 RepID=UPI001B00C99D|nr:lipid A-modifier LpxR family protein [Maricaulis sp.]MBO6796174.1 DUF2219 family protein [Maricaulis sp.]
MRMGRKSELTLATLIALSGVSYVLMTPGQAVEWANPSALIQANLAAEGEIRPLSASAANIARTALSLDADIAGQNAFAASTLPHATTIDLGPAGELSVAVLDDDTGDVAFDLLAITADNRSPLVFEPERDETTVALAYQRSFDSYGGSDELDVSIIPRAGVSLGNDGTAAGAGAELRVGQHLGNSLQGEPRWYMFAGADRRALLYNPSEGANFDSAMALTRREVIGDAQAGVAVRFGDADLSVAYVRREYQHVAGVTAFEESEEFGAVTLNWRW